MHKVNVSNECNAEGSHRAVAMHAAVRSCSTTAACKNPGIGRTGGGSLRHQARTQRHFFLHRSLGQTTCYNPECQQTNRLDS